MTRDDAEGGEAVNSPIHPLAQRTIDLSFREDCV